MRLLKNLYRIHSHSGNECAMGDFLIGQLKNMFDVVYSQDEVGNIYATKGISSTYPCVVAHMDEVHVRNGKMNIMECDGVLFGYDSTNHQQCGIGADDKNGLWVAMKCLERFDAIKIAFFVGEEIGCIGSRSANMSFFDDCRFVLQCDRKGKSDFITNASGAELCDSKFVEAIGSDIMNTFGYSENSGLMTDVMALKENGLAVCAANISCGYYKPHSSEEYTVMVDLRNCLDFVCAIIEKCTDVYPHTYSYTPLWGWYDYTPKKKGKRKKKKESSYDDYLYHMELEDAEFLAMEFENIDDYLIDSGYYYTTLSEDELRTVFHRVHDGVL